MASSSSTSSDNESLEDSFAKKVLAEVVCLNIDFWYIIHILSSILSDPNLLILKITSIIKKCLLIN